MKKKIVMLIMGMTCCVMLAACGNKGNQGKDPLTGEEQSSQEMTGIDEAPVAEGDGNTDTRSEFDTMVANDTEPSGIINYINTNIGTAAKEDVEYFLGGLLNFGNDVRDIDFSNLEQSRQYMPEDMIAFMDLMKLERESPSMVMSNEENRRVIGLTLSEMLERGLLFEQHLDKYPDNVTTEAATRIYEEIATAAITGGYDKTQGIAHYYQGENANTIDQESLKYYQQFAEANPDTRLGKLVAEYVKVLQDNQFQINDTMEEFYKNINHWLRPVVNEDVTNTGVNTGNNNTTNGTTTNNGTGNNGTTTNGNLNNGTTTNGTANNANNTSNSNARNANTTGTTNNANTGNTTGVNNTTTTGVGNR